MFTPSYKSNRLQRFIKIDVLKNFAIIRESTALESLFHKVPFLKISFIKKRLQHGCFPVKFA